MAFTPTLGTGFEMGAIPIAATDMTACTLETTVVKTGTYSIKLRCYSTHAYIRFAHTGAYLDLAAWVYPYSSAGATCNVGAVLDDGKEILLKRVGTTWNLYVDGVLAQTGTFVTAGDSWQHVQARIFIDDAGTVETKIDGVSDIDYSGDTKPSSSSEISWILFENDPISPGYQNMYVDDIAYGSGGWPGDIRFDGLLPTGDVETEWTPSAGVDHYALVDERPPSDADYVSAGSPALRDVYSGGDWSGAAKTPQFLMQWARAKKDSAGTRQLKFIVSSDSTESAGSLFDLTTAYTYYKRVLMTDPSTGSPWTEGAIDAVLFGMESG